MLDPAEDGTRHFDLILLSDLVFNHSQHGALLDSCLACLSPSLTANPATIPLHSSSTTQNDIDLSLSSLTTPALLCFYSHHRPTPELIAADIGLFSLAREKGWTVTKVWEDTAAGVSPVRLDLCYDHLCSPVIVNSLHFQLMVEILVSGAPYMDGL